jgi:hypothetical protein
MRASVAILIALAALTPVCGGKPRATFVYHDLRCTGPLPDGGAGGCEDVGDGASHVICQTNPDCPGNAPYCRSLGLFNGGDFLCNDHVLICRTVDHDDCPL